MLMIGQQLLTVFNLDLFDLNLSDVVFTLLCLQLPLLFLEELARIFNFTFFVLNLDFN